jgi:myosin-5
MIGLNSDRHDNNNNMNDILIAEPHCSQILEKLQQEKDYELIKSQEIELENQKLREDLNRLRDLCADNQMANNESLINLEMMNQFDALNEECQRRREECIQLKSLIVSRNNTNKYLNGNGLNDMSSDNGTDMNSIVTDGNEFEIGYNTQKLLNRILENQNLDMKRQNEEERKVMQREINKLKEETERQQEILMQNLSPESLAEATYKNEILKLTEDNLVNIFIQMILKYLRIFQQFFVIFFLIKNISMILGAE